MCVCMYVYIHVYKVSLHSASFCFSSKLPCSVADIVVQESWKEKKEGNYSYYNTSYFYMHIYNVLSHILLISKLRSTFSKAV